MRHFSAHFVYTGKGEPLRRPLITTDNQGTILSVSDTGGDLAETSSLAWYNGIIVPGFVNCHCHLELSHYKGLIEDGGGLPAFIAAIRRLREGESREGGSAEAVEKARHHDSLMASEGIVACADICNGSDSFPAKEDSSLFYVSLLEVFGTDSASAAGRMAPVLVLAAEAESRSLNYNITPHSAYSLSLELMRLIAGQPLSYPLSSLHFMEAAEESVLLSSHGGSLAGYYRQLGVDAGSLSLPASHADAVLSHVRTDGSLLLVHNTHADPATIDRVNSGRPSTWWCLCPASNLYIGGSLPPLTLLRDKDCSMVIGTDSLASNSRLSILAELLILQEHFPGISLAEMIGWASLNGAMALGIDGWAGSIEEGKRPGLLLIENADLNRQRLTKDSRIKRLI